MKQKPQPHGAKITGLLFFVIFTLPGKGASLLYEFKGTIQSATSFNSVYPESDLMALLGVPQVSYLFEIDFERNVSTSSNAAATWNFFYARLLGKGVMDTVLESEATPTALGFNGDFISIADTAQIHGDGVRISAQRGTLLPFPRWMVQDWQVGDQLRLQDSTYPNLGEGATFYFGSVTLTSIQPIPEPCVLPLAAMGVVLLSNSRRRRNA